MVLKKHPRYYIYMSGPEGSRFALCPRCCIRKLLHLLRICVKITCNEWIVPCTSSKIGLVCELSTNADGLSYALVHLKKVFIPQQ